MKMSETLEVRVTHESKQALMSKAAGEGRSASDVVRGFVGQYVEGQIRPNAISRSWWIALALAVVAPAAVLASSTPQSPSPAAAASSDAQARALEQFLASWVKRAPRPGDAKAFRTLSRTLIGAEKAATEAKPTPRDR